MARLLTALGDVLAAERPDRVVVQGDTATALAGALAACHHRLPVAHVEAGLRSGDAARPWPEESYRRMIATLADLHFAPTPAAAMALIAEKARGGIHVTGNTVIDALHWMRDRLVAEPALAAALDPVLAPLAGRRLILVTTHRRESWHAGTGIVDAVATLARRPDVAILWPLHPRAAIRDAVRARIGERPNLACIPALDYPQFVRALAACDLVLTDSGGVQEEAPALGKPVLVLRDATERPEAIALGNARSPYGDGRAAARIAALIAGVAMPADRLESAAG
jgi:UDP-N-acetylglucosamine 2-epimerase (non-hydrolysing)